MGTVPWKLITFSKRREPRLLEIALLGRGGRTHLHKIRVKFDNKR
jgi:hypothetical protein